MASEAKQSIARQPMNGLLPGFAPRNDETRNQGIANEAFVEIRHHCLWRYRLYRSARRRISRAALYRQVRSEMGDGRAQSGEARIRPRRDWRACRHVIDPGRCKRSRIAEINGRSDQ